MENRLMYEFKVTEEEKNILLACIMSIEEIGLSVFSTPENTQKLNSLVTALENAHTN